MIGHQSCNLTDDLRSVPSSKGEGATGKTDDLGAAFGANNSNLGEGTPVPRLWTKTDDLSALR
jgi:hypothetical protein